LGQGLRDLADQQMIRIGTAADPAHLTEADYADTLAREFSQLEPENAMKFGPIQPGPTTYNFGPPDALVAFAMEHNIAVRGHTLVWHEQNPQWLVNGGFRPEQLSQIMHEHIRNVVGRYAGQVYAWDVVNEAFNGDGSLRSTLWSNSPGIGLPNTAYIEQAFRWAHEADPQALLFYNDYYAEPQNPKSDAIYQMARDFKARGVPIDGIGFQMHLTDPPGPLPSIEANIRRLEALGLQVQITELDVRLSADGTGSSTSRELLARQARIYREVMRLCLKYPGCTAIQTWGFTDKYSWLPAFYPLEFDANYQPKPAYGAMKVALGGLAAQ
jgi:endo-1,4-beta-xylanase